MRKSRILWALVCFAIFYVASMCLSIQESKAGVQTLKRVAFVPQKDEIVAVSSSEESGVLLVWSIDGTIKQRFNFGKRVWGTSMAVSNKGDSVILGLVGGPNLMCYSLVDKSPVWTAGIERGLGLLSTSPISFTTDDSRVVVVGFKNIIIFDPKSGAIVERQENSGAFSFGLPKYRTRIDRLSHTGRYAAFFQGKLEHDEPMKNNVWITVYDIEKKKLVAKQAYVQEGFKNCSADFTRDERNLVLGSMNGVVRVWAIPDQKVVRQWEAYGNMKAPTFKQMPFSYFIDSVTLSPDGRLVATIGLNAGDVGFSIKIWEYTTGRQFHEFLGVFSNTMCSGYPMAFSPDGKYFTFERQGQLCLYDTQEWKEKWCVSSWPEGKD